MVILKYRVLITLKMVVKMIINVTFINNFFSFPNLKTKNLLIHEET